MLLGAVLLLLLLGGAGPASAHAALRDADPRDGKVLKTAPRHVTLTFTESVGLLDDSFRVLDPDNRRVHTGEPGHADGRSDTARVSLPRDLGTGTFTVAWRVVSADSHPVSGAFTFSVGAPSATSAVVPSDGAGDTVAGTLYDVFRYAAYAAVALLVGTAAFTAVTGFGALRGLLLAGWWTLFAATVALLLLRGPYERGSGPATAFDPSVLSATLTSRPGVALLARLVLLAVVALLPLLAPRTPGRDAPETGPVRAPQAMTGPGRGSQAVTGLLAVGLASTWAAAEHASAGIQVPVAMVSAVLHLLAMSVWLGGLAALLTALHRSPEAVPAQAVARFSRLAFAAVSVLVATGVYQSWRGLGSWDALTTTSYGRILTAKLAAVLLVLAAAAWSRRWTGRLVTAGSGTATGEYAVPAGRRGVVRTRVPEPVGTASHGDTEGVGGPGTATASASADADVDGGPGTVTGGTTAGSDGNTEPNSYEGSRDPDDPAADRGPTPDSKPAGPAEAPHRRALRRSVLAEVTVGIVVLVITTVLTGTQPGRAEAETTPSAAETAAQPADTSTLIPFDVGTPGGHGKVQIDLGPGRVGENTVQAVVFGPDGGIATVPELRLSFTLTEQKVGPLDAKLTNRGGYWGTDGVNLPLPGTWTMKVTVRTTDIDQVTVSKTVRIG
ncbi:copper resistance CopC/CopD family protein [Streptomyces sp. NPDC005551]|uniref:copper resistance CopC/CopD family protein n=1 Tax=Streptomyces sp. NPDC005551 TaxID=3364725 RepID=UPI00369C8602